MCGIFGFIGRSSWKTSALLQALCIADEVRGKHSSGIVIQQSSGACYLQKKALRGKEFVAKGHTSFLFHKDYALALGHNRYATAGAVNDRNAHPFGVKLNGGWNFGIHNGIVGGKKRIAERFAVAEPDVDSEVVFRAIAKLQEKGMDIVDAIESVTEFISADADFAFVYLDTSKQSIYMWRSNDRPLCIIDARKLGLGRWFCSTKEIFTAAWNMLRGALGPLKKVSYFDAKPYRLYKAVNDGKFEIEPVRELKRQERKKEITFNFNWQAEQSTSSRNRSYDNDYDYYGVREMTDEDLDFTLFNTQIEVDGMFPDDPIHDEWKDYLRAIKAEIARREWIKNRQSLNLF